jgi:inorganic pyrophosphatase
MNPWHDIDKGRVTPENFIAVVEIPKGSKKKYELDKATGLIKLDRILFTATHYPSNYGFIPRTYADDKDPLDVLVLCSEILDPLTMVECYPIGVVKMVDNNEVDEKIIAVPFRDPVYSGYRDISTLPQHIVQEISHFFEVYKELEHSETSVKMTMDREKAIAIIQNCIAAYDEAFKPVALSDGDSADVPKTPDGHQKEAEGVKLNQG